MLLTRRRSQVAASLALIATFGGVSLLLGSRVMPPTIPERIGDEAFWRMVSEFSEPGGFFRSDNFVSNEITFQWVLPEIAKTTKTGGVYMGVGPDQNFTYIVAMQPKIAFIVDIRRQNMLHHLLYKSLIEMSADRAEFVSRLFTKKRPANLTPKSSAAEIMNAFWDIQTDGDPVYKENLQAIKDFLTKGKHSLPLSKEDLDGIEYVYYNFYWFGPLINYNSSSNGGGFRGGNMVDYATLMMAVDATGKSVSYLASEETFKTMKDLEERNLLVPVVGDFGGPKALRAVGQYVREHGATVSAFYLSNVEQYLQQDGKWNTFCGNVASMPLTEQSTFIRSAQGGRGGPGGGLVNDLGWMQSETKGCAGR